MMKKVFYYVLLFFLPFLGFSQNNSTTSNPLYKKTILTVDTANISVEEFLWFNKKYNMKDDSVLRLPLDEYCVLFAEYKMKVIEAEHKQLDTSRAFIKEFQSYLKPTVRKYLYNTQVEEDFIKLEYERLQYDIEVQHIFIRRDKFAKPSDTLLAYKKAQRIKADLLSGKDFVAYAKEFSDDSFTKNEGGYVGYVTSLLLPLTYENAIYNAQVGQLIGPISTQYGYYIVKILNKRQTTGQHRASLIVLYPNEDNAIEWEKTKIKIDSIYTCLKNGEDFFDLCKRYNVSPKLLSKDCDIGWFDNSMQYGPEMKEAIFGLDSVGQFTKPIKENYGYIIALLTDRAPLRDYKQMYTEIKKYIVTDETRAQFKERVFLLEYKKKNKITYNTANLEEFITLVDNSILVNRWKAPKFAENKPLLVINSFTFYYSDFAQYLQSKGKHSKIAEKDILVRFRYYEYVDKMIEYVAFRELPEKNKEFALLMQEYHDGMIMYELLQREIYTKASKDTVGLQGYYTANIANYMNPHGLIITEFNCKDAKTTQVVKNLIAKRGKKPISDLEILAKVNKKDPQAVTLDTIIYYKGKQGMFENYEWKEGFTFSDVQKVYVFNKVLEPSPIPLEECRSQVIADYQFWLELLWKDYLKKKYSFKINEQVLSQVKLEWSKL